MVTRVIVGVAGSGKTASAMGVIEDEIRNGLKASQIGFASFSRAATNEAAERASRLTGEDVTSLQKNGWFRTLHSCALRCLGIDKKTILDHDSEDGRKFLRESIGSERGGDAGTLAAKVDEILSAWDFIRARLTLLAPVEPENTGGWCKENQCFIRESDTPGRHGTPEWWPGTPEFCGGCPAKTQSFAEENSRRSAHLDITHMREENNQIDHSENFSGGFSENTLSCVCKTLEKSGTPTQEHSGATIRKPNVFDKKTESIASVQALRTVQTYGKSLIQKYEAQKRLFGRLDFTDILMSFAGIQVRDDLTFYQGYPNGAVPQEIEVWLFDEAQDCSPLLGKAAQRLAGAAGEVYWLGDRFQSIYAFAGASASFFAELEDRAKSESNRILLNRSWRNPTEVLEWGESVLRESGGYEERNPFSEAEDGSVGLMDWDEFLNILPSLAGSDTIILARAWFSLAKVKARLDDAQTPWRSCQEKTSSRWEAPAKIAYVLVMRELTAGMKISEQDWRRVTETLPAKMNGKELFVRGTKAKWKKAECSNEPQKTLDQTLEWGATPEFVEFVKQSKWRTDIALLLDIAITKHGIEEVRNPSIRLGSCHSAKGLEARNVFCLAASTQRIEQDGDPAEEICLKYVSITRASKHYRLVVNQLDLARGKPVFWSAPRNETKYLKGFNDAGIRHSKADPAVVEDSAESLGGEISGGNIWADGKSRHSDLPSGAIHKSGSKEQRRPIDADAATDEDADQFGWWNL